MQLPEYGPLQLCRNKAGYEVVPRGGFRWKLDAVERALNEGGFETVANAGGMLLVMRHASTDVSVFENGKLLFKTKEKARAEQMLDAAREALTTADGAP